MDIQISKSLLSILLGIFPKAKNMVILLFVFWGTAMLVFHIAIVAQSCPTLCNPMDHSTPGFPVLHHLLELAQTHVQWVGDALQPSHPLSPPSLPALNLPQHQGLFQWVSSADIREPEWQDHFTSPPAVHKGSSFSTSLPTLAILWFSDSSHPSGC